jgi:hypothetical protein
MARAEREIVAASLDALRRLGPLAFVRRRREADRLYHLLRADGVPRGRALRLRRRTLACARRMRVGRAMDGPDAVDLILTD